MKRIIIILVAVLLGGASHGQLSQRQRLVEHVYTLASDSLQGREAGSEGGRLAAEYITHQWLQMGLKPFDGDDYRMSFKSPEAIKSKTLYNNLVAVIEGSDPVLKDEYIVVGAHYDHLGVQGGQVYNGADDNASGTACVIEIAHQLLSYRDVLRRSILICAFDAEELGLYGSRALVNELRKREMLDQVKLMLSVDMVGWYKAGGKLVLEGTSTLDHPSEWILPEQVHQDISLNCKSYENSILTATDTEPFAKEGIATLAVTTGLKSPYHKPTDDADLIDYDGLDRVTNYLAALVVAASVRDGALASGKVAPKHRPAHGLEVGVALGYNRSHLDFPEATFTGKESWGFNGGLMMQYNFNNCFALRASALYSYSHCLLPAGGDAYGKGFGLEQHLLLVPVTVQIGFRDAGMGIYCGVGGYYGRVFDGRFYGDVPSTEPAYDIHKNQVGIVLNLGLRLGGHWQLDGSWYHQLTDLFSTTGGLPKAHWGIHTLTLGYYF